MVQDDEIASFEVFQDSVSTTVIAKLAPSPKGSRRRVAKGRKNEIKPVVKAQTNDDDGDDARELSDFVEVRCSITTYCQLLIISVVLGRRDICLSPIRPPFTIIRGNPRRSLTENQIRSPTGHIPPNRHHGPFATHHSRLPPDLRPHPRLHRPRPLPRTHPREYIVTTTSPSPEYTPALTATRPAGCEICEREHLPLTYHHLIPRQMHAKAVKRGWHREWELNKVAWLCRACHSYLHRVATNEELARELYSVELVLERDDVGKWARWVGRVRWKAR